jgi:hypothetical protein
MTPIKGVVRCQCYRCGAALEFDLIAAHQRQPQPSWQPARPQGQQEPQSPPRPQQWRQGQPARHTPRLEMTPERAAGFVMPIGKFKGLTLEQIHQRQPTYIRWLAETMDRAIGRAAKGYLELCQGQAERN